MANVDETLESFISAEDDNAGIPYEQEAIDETSLNDNYQEPETDFIPLQGDYPVNTPDIIRMLIAASSTSDTDPATESTEKVFSKGKDAASDPAISSARNDLVNKTMQELMTSTDNMRGSEYNIEFNPDGSKKSITIKGDPENTEFQGIGKYRTPQEFLAKDPETFKRVNPGLWHKMEREQAAAAATATNLGVATFKNIEAQMDLISQEKDPVARQKALSDLQVQVAETAANLAKDTRLMAEQQSGLTAAKTALAASEARDRAHPDWNLHLSDSRETLALRKQVAQASAMSGSLTNRLLKENPLIAGMTAKINNFFKTEQSRVSKELVASDNIDRAIEAEKMTISDDTAKYLTYLNPKINNDPAEAAKLKLALKADPMKKALIAELAPFYDPAFKESDILPLAIQGNNAAVKILVKVQQEKTGADPAKTEEDIKLAQRFVRDPQFFTEQMKPLAVKDPQLAELLKAQTTGSFLDKGKEAEQRRLMQRAGLLDAWMSSRKTNIAVNNIESWNGDKTLRASPELADTIDKIKTLQPNKSISLSTLVDQYVSQAPKELQADRMAQIKEAMISNVEKNNKGLYGNIDLITMNNKLKISQSMGKSFSTVVGKGLDFAADALYNTNNELNPNNGMFPMGVR